MKNINEINTIEALEEYTEEITGRSIIRDSSNEYYGEEALGADLCDFTDSQKSDLIEAASRVLDCISTARHQYNNDLADAINGRFWAIIDSVRAGWEE